MFNVLLLHVFYLIVLMVIIAFVTVIVKHKELLEQTYPADSTQNQPQRQNRDRFVDHALGGAT